jgi:hypothetical protein
MVGRFAGKALQYLTKGIGPGEMTARLSMDALGGLMAAAYTPGDLGDKIIAGTASTLGGAAGGLALGKLGGGNPMLGTALDFAGSIGGDMAASVLGEQAMKGKSALQGEGFRSPYQKLSDEQQKQLAEAIRADVMRQYGLIAPSTIAYADPSTGMGVS